MFRGHKYFELTFPSSLFHFHFFSREGRPSPSHHRNPMAVSSCARAFPSFECRSDAEFSGGIPRHDIPNSGKASILSHGSSIHGLSSLIYRFPPNFVRQLSIKARRNCSNIGVAQVVAASCVRCCKSREEMEIEEWDIELEKPRRIEKDRYFLIMSKMN
ncbi:cystathionine gamma-synthase 1, chloroplastic [Nicotiana attenuata]|uniref:Cystathionine gamma-synthase 1, chloroplastic n=1 Tax=Nicotiana attenuata TaxID=49451 RepID=A0A314KMY4_NICAT|nr:cystathionine gamma-synthase 1, chloroplastic [Nicotiana attenuata]